MTDQTPPRNKRPTFSDQEALDFHSMGRPGKLEVVATVPMATQRDLSLAYSPGVAVPVLAIAEDPATAYDYTAKGNMVGRDLERHRHPRARQSRRARLEARDGRQIGPLQALRRRRFLRHRGRYRGRRRPSSRRCAISHPAFGGINLEDIKAPECFIIEERLKELMPIPVFHDDQHGTAIIAAAGLLNAFQLTGRDLRTAKLVINGAGSAGISCVEVLKALGFAPNNVMLCDTKGVIYRGRTRA